MKFFKVNLFHNNALILTFHGIQRKMRIREHGIQARERSRVYRSKPKCESDGKNFGSVRLVDCYAALFILVYGFVASVLIFGIEKFLKLKINNMIGSTLEMCRNNFLEE